MFGILVVLIFAISANASTQKASGKIDRLEDFGDATRIYFSQWDGATPPAEGTGHFGIGSQRFAAIRNVNADVWPS
jgi:hypothetical protein